MCLWYQLCIVPERKWPKLNFPCSTEFCHNVCKNELLVCFVSNQCTKRVQIIRIWNRIINFGTGSGYPVSGKRTICCDWMFYSLLWVLRRSYTIKKLEPKLSVVAFVLWTLYECDSGIITVHVMYTICVRQELGALYMHVFVMTAPRVLALYRDGRSTVTIKRRAFCDHPAETITY